MSFISRDHAHIGVTSYYPEMTPCKDYYTTISFNFEWTGVLPRVLIQSVMELGLLTSYITLPHRGSHHLFTPDPTGTALESGAVRREESHTNNTTGPTV